MNRSYCSFTIPFSPSPPFCHCRYSLSFFRHRCRALNFDDVSCNMESGLYIVSTPIGNLADITYRAVHVLNHVSCVYAEDTRRTRKLFSALGITKPLISCHAHNEVVRKNEIVEKIQSGNVILYDTKRIKIADLDCGHCKRCRNAIDQRSRKSIDRFRYRRRHSRYSNSRALSCSSRPHRIWIRYINFLFHRIFANTNSFVSQNRYFIDFLSLVDRQRKLELFEDVPAPLIIFVAPSNLLSVLQSCIEVFGESRKCTIAKEITKIYEVSIHLRNKTVSSTYSVSIVDR